MNFKVFFESFLKVAKWIWKFFVGGIIVLIAFLGNFKELKKPNISLEIIGIEQSTTTEVDISAIPELKNTNKLFGSYRYFLGPQLHTIKTMLDGLDREKVRLENQKTELLELRQNFQKQLSEGKQLSERARLSERKIGLNFSNIFEPNDFGRVDEYTLINGNQKEMSEYISKIESTIQKRQTLIESSGKEISSFKEKSERRDAKISVILAATNSGDGSTTLKPQAILRTNLGEGNYLDIALRIKNYETTNAEIKPRSTSILRFDSAEISSMSPSDQERFLSFFKNTSPTNLYAVDVKGNYLISNTIPFAQGIYEQKIYDGLKTYASTTQKKIN